MTDFTTILLNSSSRGSDLVETAAELRLLGRLIGPVHPDPESARQTARELLEAGARAADQLADEAFAKEARRRLAAANECSPSNEVTGRWVVEDRMCHFEADASQPEA